jgi:hypothetical protein
MDHHWIQLCFWAVTNAAVASALLKAGGTSALQAVQAVSIIMGLPLNMLALYAMQCIYHFCRKSTTTDNRDLDFHHDSQDFQTPIYGGVFNVMEYMFSLGQVHPKRISKGMNLPTAFHLKESLKGAILPFRSLLQTLQYMYPQHTKRNSFCILLYTMLLIAWVVLFSYNNRDLDGLAWAFFAMAGTFLAFIRNEFRQCYGLRSNAVGDLVSSVFFWPQVLMQMREETLRMNDASKHSEELGSTEEEGV